MQGVYIIRTFILTSFFLFIKFSFFKAFKLSLRGRSAKEKKQRDDRRESMNTFENNEVVNKIAASCLPQAGKIYRNGSASHCMM